MDNMVFRNLSYGMYVLGANDDRNVGCVVNTAFQITSSPATIAVSVNHDNYTNLVISKTGKFSLSILGEDIDSSIIATFGYTSSKDHDKFANVEYEMIDELPVIKDSVGYILCNVINTMETETHTVFLGEIVDMGNYVQKNPMTYSYYHKVLKGKSPKNAPTYIEENKDKVEADVNLKENDEELDWKEKGLEAKEKVEENESKKKIIWKCTICGYEVEMDELPDDYRCPICGHPKSDFVRIER